MKSSGKFLVAVCTLAMVLMTGAGSRAAGRFVIEQNESIREAGLHKGHSKKLDIINIRRGNNATYTFKYRRCVDPSHQKDGTPVGDGDTGLGLLIPSLDWYHNNSIEIIADGKSVTAEVPASYNTVDAKGKGIVAFTWDTSKVTAKLIFIISDERNEVLLDAKITPKTNLQSLSIFLRSFPAIYTLPHKIAGHRWVVTSAGKEEVVKSFVEENVWRSEADKKMVLSPSDESWVFYADKLLDVADNKPELSGPCGLFFLPQNINNCNVVVGGYNIDTTLNLQPAGGDVRLALVDFYKWPNAKALDFMKTEGPAVKTLLSESDFQVSKYLSDQIDKTVAKIDDNLDDMKKSSLSGDDAATVSAYAVQSKKLGEISHRTQASDSDLVGAFSDAEALLKKVSGLCARILVK